MCYIPKTERNVRLYDIFTEQVREAAQHLMWFIYSIKRVVRTEIVHYIYINCYLEGAVVDAVLVCLCAVLWSMVMVILRTVLRYQ